MASAGDIFAFFEANVTQDGDNAHHYVLIGVCSCEKAGLKLYASLDMLPENFNAICANERKHKWTADEIVLAPQLTHLKRKRDVAAALDSWRSFRRYIRDEDRVSFPVDVHDLEPAVDPDADTVEQTEDNKLVLSKGAAHNVVQYSGYANHAVARKNSHVLVVGSDNNTSTADVDGVIPRIHGTAHFLKDLLWTYGPAVVTNGLAIYMACRNGDASCVQDTLSNTMESLIPGIMRRPASPVILQSLSDVLRSLVFSEDIDRVQERWQRKWGFIPPPTGTMVQSASGGGFVIGEVDDTDRRTTRSAAAQLRILPGTNKTAEGAEQTEQEEKAEERRLTRSAFGGTR